MNLHYLIRTDWDIAQLGKWDPESLHSNISVQQAMKINDADLKALGLAAEFFSNYTVRDEIVKLQLPVEPDPYMQSPTWPKYLYTQQ
jgi:hypothetical protein